MQIFAKVKKILNFVPSEKLNVNFCKSEYTEDASVNNAKSLAALRVCNIARHFVWAMKDVLLEIFDVLLHDTFPVSLFFAFVHRHQLDRWVCCDVSSVVSP